jgi:NAD(P)-dependent dehydrogenase (short-subunit alcohol dehydrogenase family)
MQAVWFVSKADVFATSRERDMKVAITGGATGIGAEVAKKLKSHGHHVTAFDISAPEANVDDWIQTDLNDPASVAAAVDAAVGPFDALINNAGLPPRAGLEDVILRVNYFGFKALLEGMLDKLSEGAAIVNTASRAGAFWRDNIEQVKALMALDPAQVGAFIADNEINSTRAYNLSKEAVIVYTMTQTQAMIGRGFRMNSVSPAAVSTGILDDFAAAFGDKMVKNVARAGRPGLPEEVADVILYLASPQSNWIKGQDICVDGGMGAMGMSEAMGLVS